MKMKKNLENLQLKELIHVAKELIPKDICRFVIDSIKDQKWEYSSFDARSNL